MPSHIVIIGGGVIGLSSAYELLQRGHAVTVVERGWPDHDSCSLGNAGMVVPSHFEPLAAPGMIAMGLKWMFNPESPFAVRPRFDTELMSWAFRFWRAATPAHVARCTPILRDMNLRSRELFVRYAEKYGNDFDLETVGLVMLCKEQKTLDHEAGFAAKARSVGVPAEVLDRTALAKAEPGASLDVAGGVLFPKDAHMSPHKFIASLTRKVEELGGKFVWDAEVAGFRTEGDRIRAAITKVGDIAGDEFVLASGAWSTGVAKAAGLSLPMQAGKGYSMLLEKPAQRPKLCSILTEARVAVTPMGSGLRVGGTMQIDGNDLTVNHRRVGGIKKSFPKYYTAFKPEDFDGVKVWAGLRPCSPDGMPYIGRTGTQKNLTVAAGHSMMGLSLGPVTGEMVAQIVAGEKTLVDTTLLNPDRYR
jgi:D-amino-acid dehydrogenase